MEAALARLRTTFDREAKAFQDVIEKEVAQRVKERESDLKKREQELDQRERAVARREKAVEQRENAPKPPAKTENGSEPRSFLQKKGDEPSTTKNSSPSKIEEPKPASVASARAPLKLSLSTPKRESLAPSGSAAKVTAMSFSSAAKLKSKLKGIRGERKDRSQLAKRVQFRKKFPDWGSADPKKWNFTIVEASSDFSYHRKPELDKIQGPIATGIDDLKAHPDLYEGIFYQAEFKSWPQEEQRYTVVKRTGAGFHMTGQRGGPWRWIRAKYENLPATVKVDPDKYTDRMKFAGYALRATRMPGRGQGTADEPGIKIVDVAHPLHVMQGLVGDCWLLSAMSAVAEFQGCIRSMFRKTPDLDKRPLPTFNKYTITLYDLSTPDWDPVDVVVDERLLAKPDNSKLLACHPSNSGELWACYLEKAVAAHCGGWDEIHGGQVTHAWKILLGRKEVYHFNRKKEGWACFGQINPVTKQWAQMDNSPKKSSTRLWPMSWPEVGGGGDPDMKLSDEELFERMCVWDDSNFILAAGTTPGSDTEDENGIVQGHAYSVITCLNNVAGTDFDLVKVRNPWGHGEFTDGQWIDDGPGWEEYPQVKAEINPGVADNGIFWMSKEEFFQYFVGVYICAVDMATWQSG